MINEHVTSLHSDALERDMAILLVQQTISKDLFTNTSFSHSEHLDRS